MNRFAFAGMIALALGGVAHAQTAQGDLSVGNVWARATPSATANGAVYFTVTDKGAPDTLTGASTPVAAKAQLHESTMEGGVMKMRPVESLAVDQGHPITLAPGGYHLMLTGMKQQLKAGTTFPLTLDFTHAGAVSTVVKVEAIGARSDTDPMPGMDMGKMGH